MTTPTKTRLPFLLRLSFFLSVLTILSINLAANWPPWRDNSCNIPLLSRNAVEPAVAIAYDVEWETKSAMQPRVGLLTYVKRNYKRWIREYAQSKVKEKLKKLLNSGNPSPMSPQKQ